MISVIIPCYNVSQYINRCIDSVLSNTYCDLQVICINDGSTDNTLDILQSYTDERITVISHENKGLSASRNIGMEKAKGEFICFIDSDDWIHKSYFETLIQIQKKTQADIVYCKYRITSEDCKDKEISDFNITQKKFYEAYDNSVLGDVVWSKLYKADIIGDTRFVDVFSEDKLFNAELLMSHKNAVCAVADVELYYYYMRPESIIHVYHEDRLLTVAKYFLKMSNETSDSEIYNLFLERSIKIGLSTRYMTMFRKELNAYNKSCDEFLKSLLGKISVFPFSRRMMYSLFIRFSSLYRYIRKKKDPSMADWEKNEIKSQKAK